jgi:hypothetical protein
VDLVYNSDAELHNGETFELTPKFGEFATEIAYYDQIVMIKGQTAHLTEITGPVDVTLDPPPASSIAVGAVLRFQQTWTPRAITLGKLLYSLPLAAGESTKIAVIDWTRRTRTSSSEEVTQSESLSNRTEQNQAVDEVTGAVASQVQAGFSASASTSATASEAAAGAAWSPAAAGAAGESASMSASASTSVSGSAGVTDVSSSYGQKISNATEQASRSQRAKRAALVTEATQEEREQLSTRTVTNYNHMHALNVLYFEVVQLYRVALALSNAERVIFIPMKPLSFDNEQVIFRFRFILARCALRADMRARLVTMSENVSVALLLARARHLWDIRKAESSDDEEVPREELKRRAVEAAKSQIVVKQSFASARMLDNAVIDVASDFDSWSMPPSVVFLNAGWGTTPGRISKITVTTEEGTVFTLRDNIGIRNNDPPLNRGLNNGPIALSSVQKITLEFSESKQSEAQTVMLYFQTEMNVKFGLRCDCVLRQDRERADLISFSTDPLANDLKTHLKQNALYYSQHVWRSMDPRALSAVLAQFSVNGKALIDFTDTAPLAVSGNYAIFRWNGDNDPDWIRWKTERLKQFSDERFTALPTGGVFAEAVLGRANCAEKIDITRFWNWQDSPAPVAAPDIAALQAGQHQAESAERPGGLESPVLNIVNPPPLLQTPGLAGLLGTMLQPNLFRDMSGLAGTQALTHAGMQTTAQSANSALSAITGLAGTASILGAGSAVSAGRAANGALNSRSTAAFSAGTPVERGMERLLSPLANSHTAAAGAIGLGRALDQSNGSGGGGIPLGSGSSVGPSFGSASGSMAQDAFDRLLPGGTGGQEGNVVQAAIDLGKDQLPGNIDLWKDVFLHKVPASMQQALASRGLRVQDFAFSDNPTLILSSPINLDLYQVKITQMPKKADGSDMSQRELLKSVRLNMSDVISTANFFSNPFSRDFWPLLIKAVGALFTPMGLVADVSAPVLAAVTGTTTFKPFEDQDKTLFESDNPLGAVMQFDSAADDMGVVLSDFAADHWIFSTVRDSRLPFFGDVGTHPVSGNRKWTIQQDPAGSVIVSNKAADRASGRVETGVGDLLFLGGHVIWLCWQAGVKQLVEDAGGSAEIVKPISDRFNFALVDQHFSNV